MGASRNSRPDCPDVDQSLRERWARLGANRPFLDIAQTQDGQKRGICLVETVKPGQIQRPHVACEFQKYNTRCGYIGFPPIHAFIIS